jgi:peptidyl-prolyl cis-trans isomerase C
MTRIARAGLWAAAALLVVTATAAEAKDKKNKQAAQAAAVATDTTEVLVWVGGQPLTKGELEGRLEELSPQFRQQFTTPEGRQQLLDRLVEEKVWLLAAEKAGVADRKEVKRQIEQSRLNLVVRAYLTDLMQNMPAPGDSAVQAYYDAHKSEPGFQVPEARTVRHIQLATEREARSALLQLKQGADFGALAKKLSKDASTRETGGDVGRVERFGTFGGLGRQPALSESTFTARLHVPMGPIRSSLGWHVIEVRDTISAGFQPLENVRPRILSTLTRSAQEDFYKGQLDSMKTAEGYRANQAVVDSFLHGRKSSAELFRDAQDALTADDRIAAYEQVVAQYPQSEQAPQAEFMVGFVYSEEKKDYDKAEAAFKKLLADYPKSELTNSAQWMLDNMRSDAVPNFELPGGVKRSVSAPSSTDTPGLKVSPAPKGGKSTP